MKKQILLIGFLLFTGSMSFAQAAWQYTEPASLNDGWATAHLKTLEVDTSRIYQLFNQLQGSNHKVHSMILVKDGRLIIEEYFDGYDSEKQHDLRSVTKSITSVLMGIAIDKGFVDSLDDPYTKYIRNPAPRNNRDSRKEQITIRHLMTMSTGLDCNDWDSDSRGQEDRVYQQRDWLQYFLDLPMLHDPGTVPNYCTMGQVLATEIISRASGMPIDEFAGQFLFGPLGIEHTGWGHTSRGQVIPSAKRLYMTPRDMAKIGLLIQNNGSWMGMQIVSETWVQESTSAITNIGGMDYGLLWWNVPVTVKNETVVMKAATGNGGQYIFIVPALNLVAVFTGGAYNSQDDKLPFAVMRDIVLYTFLGD
jgi:CubicO group peptidase (beta-lactamase class C family)